MREAKRQYSEKLQQQFSANDSGSVWKGLRQITNYKPKPPHSINDLHLANELNEAPSRQQCSFAKTHTYCIVLADRPYRS